MDLWMFDRTWFKRRLRIQGATVMHSSELFFSVRASNKLREAARDRPSISLDREEKLRY